MSPDLPTGNLFAGIFSTEVPLFPDIPGSCQTKKSQQAVQHSCSESFLFPCLSKEASFFPLSLSLPATPTPAPPLCTAMLRYVATVGLELDTLLPQLHESRDDSDVLPPLTRGPFLWAVFFWMMFLWNREGTLKQGLMKCIGRSRRDSHSKMSDIPSPVWPLSFWDQDAVIGPGEQPVQLSESLPIVSGSWLRCTLSTPHITGTNIFHTDFSKICIRFFDFRLQGFGGKSSFCFQYFYDRRVWERKIGYIRILARFWGWGLEGTRDQIRFIRVGSLVSNVHRVLLQSSPPSLLSFHLQFSCLSLLSTGKQVCFINIRLRGSLVSLPHLFNSFNSYSAIKIQSYMRFSWGTQES